MEKTQFETLMLAITGLDTKLSAKIDDIDARLSKKIDRVETNLRAEMRAGFADVNKRFDRVQTKLDATFDQLSRTAADVTHHENRIRKLEGPNA